ncbi:MAG TPA: alpha/beta hydrolase family protein [Vicinamibacteria bacterium]|nr:alpha/beta hydrolase family protein [Vicinamibacteria bacterium]
MKTALAVLLCAALPASAEVRGGTFMSASLGREAAYAVQLPPSYASGTKKYPVVYALHGLFEGAGFWELRGLAAQLEALWAKGELPEFLVVAVDGGNSFYLNGPSGKYQDLVTRDAVSHVESTYRVAAGRTRRALLGISMGGYGALRIALSQPEVFGAVAAHSAMLLEKPPTREDGARGGQMMAFHRVFGDPIDAALWTASDPLALAQKVDPKAVPALYFDCGTEDRYGLAAGNQELHRRLEARGIAHEFGLYPGDHGYAYVQTVLGRSLRFIAEAFRRAGTAPR